MGSTGLGCKVGPLGEDRAMALVNQSTNILAEFNSLPVVRLSEVGLSLKAGKSDIQTAKTPYQQAGMSIFVSYRCALFIELFYCIWVRHTYSSK